MIYFFIHRLTPAYTGLHRLTPKQNDANITDIWMIIKSINTDIVEKDNFIFRRSSKCLPLWEPVA